MHRIAFLLAAVLVGGCAGTGPQPAGTSHPGPVPALTDPADLLPVPSMPLNASLAPAAETWHGVVSQQSGTVALSLRRVPANSSLQSIVQLPDPEGSDFAFVAEGPSAVWPAGTALQGGASIEFHSPVLQDVRVELLADGLVVAAAAFPAPQAHTPASDPVFHALPQATAADIPEGATLTLVAHVAATADVTLHASEEHPTRVTLGTGRR